jgi:hypothetical protein
MKLRRAMAVAAATAVIAPAAFFSAPAAFATETPSGTPTPTPSVTETSTTKPTPSDSATESAPTPPGATPGQPSPSASTTPPGTPSPSASSTPPGTPSPSPTPSASATPDPTSCLSGDIIEEPQYDANLHTSLTGLPDKIVAGSGFHSFQLNVSNTGKTAYDRVDLGVFSASINDDYDISTGHLTLQYKDPTSGKWISISLDESDAGAGYLGYTDVKAKESFSIDLRLSVDKSAPAGFGYAISAAAYADDKGNCVFSEDDSFYTFDILAAGSDPGKPNEAKPQGGKKPVPAKPVGNTQIQPQGHLAETGSSSMVPVIGTVGGIAVVLGAGVMFAMKRRRNTDAAA